MANAQGFAKVTIDGEEKVLKFDMNAMADLEEHFDLGIGAILDKNRIGIRTIRALYWAGLKWKMPGLTMERVGRMLTQKMEDEDLSLSELMEPIQKAIIAARWIKANKKEETTEVDPKN